MVLRGKLRGRVGSRRDYFKSPLTVTTLSGLTALGTNLNGVPNLQLLMKTTSQIGCRARVCLPSLD